MSPRTSLFALLLPLTSSVACLSSDPIGGGGAGGGENGGAPPIVGGGEPTDGGGTPIGGNGDGGGTSNEVCGDDVCSLAETCGNCAEDCCPGTTCGDDVCDEAESCMNCEEDCGACTACGDDTCDATEDCDSCFEDCGVCACMPDDFEPNPGSGTATPVQFGVDYCDLSICSGDVDWLEFEVTDDFTATITFLQAQGDIELEIYSGITGQYVTGSYSADDNESVTLTNQQPGTYWARIYGDDPENPSYCFRVD